MVDANIGALSKVYYVPFTIRDIAVVRFNCGLLSFRLQRLPLVSSVPSAESSSDPNLQPESMWWLNTESERTESVHMFLIFPLLCCGHRSQIFLLWGLSEITILR